MAIDPVHAPRDRGFADLEREAPLQPDRARCAGAVALVIAGEGGDGAVAVLQLVVGEPEPGAPPPRLEEREEPVDAALVAAAAELLGVVALEHVVDEDPEALVDRRLLWDREDAGELVLERAGQVEVDVGGGQREAAGAHRDERLEPGLAAARELLRAPGEVAPLVEHV